ncbi:hypothetical protein Aduo_006250 [Ancylostoma duodenale]
MFVLFPLVAAQRLCTEDTASVCLLVYWLLIHSLVDGAYREDVVRGIQNVAKTLKKLCSEVSKKFFTLKFHALIDHAIMEDLGVCGSPYQWSSSPFESVHRKLQHRIAQSTTNCEEAVMKGFIMRKEFFAKFHEETSSSNNPALTRLRRKLDEGDMNRWPVEIDLGDSWGVIRHSCIDFTDLMPEHQGPLAFHRTHYSFCSRVTNGYTTFSSHIYWSQQRDTAQNCVYILKEDGTDAFGRILVFAFDTIRRDSVVLFEEFVTRDPFSGLTDAVYRGNSPAKSRALNALFLVRTANVYFQELTGNVRVTIHALKDIHSAAVLVSLGTVNYVCRT